jgi:hypothetical protein
MKLLVILLNIMILCSCAQSSKSVKEKQSINIARGSYKALKNPTEITKMDSLKLPNDAVKKDSIKKVVKESVDKIVNPTIY